MPRPDVPTYNQVLLTDDSSTSWHVQTSFVMYKSQLEYYRLFKYYKN